MNPDEYYKHYLEETMGGKKQSINEPSTTHNKKEKVFSLSKWLLLLFFLGLLLGPYYLWKNKNHTEDISRKETIIEKSKYTEMEKKLKKEKLLQKKKIEKARLKKLAQEKEQKILKEKQLEEARIEKKKEEKIRAEKEAKARIALIEAKQKEEAKRKKEKNDSLDQKVVDAQAGIGNLEQALLSGIKKSKSTPLKNTKKVDTFNKVVVKKEKTVQKQSTTSKAEEALKMVMKNSHKTNKNNYTSALKVEAKTREEEMQYVTVKEGDTLFDIAKRIYGDAMKYPLIFGANPDILNDPARISIGQKLRVPKVKETL